MEQTISPSKSFKGYSFKQWLKRNKNTIKQLISWGVGTGVFFIPSLGMPESIGLGVGAKIASQLVVDGVDFYLSDVNIQGGGQ